MKRQTRTELDKIVMIGMSKIDQLVNQLCDDCVAPQIEVERPIFIDRNPGWLSLLAAEGRAQQLDALRYSLSAQQAQAGLYDPFDDMQGLAGLRNATSGQALGLIGTRLF
jgi:hypothetical protein